MIQNKPVHPSGTFIHSPSAAQSNESVIFCCLVLFPASFTTLYPSSHIIVYIVSVGDVRFGEILSMFAEILLGDKLMSRQKLAADKECLNLNVFEVTTHVCFKNSKNLRPLERRQKIKMQGHMPFLLFELPKLRPSKFSKPYYKLNNHPRSVKSSDIK